MMHVSFITKRPLVAPGIWSNRNLFYVRSLTKILGISLFFTSIVRHNFVSSSLMLMLETWCVLRYAFGMILSARGSKISSN